MPNGTKFEEHCKEGLIVCCVEFVELLRHSGVMKSYIRSLYTALRNFFVRYDKKLT